MDCNEFSHCVLNTLTTEPECLCDPGYSTVDGLPCQSICNLQPNYCLNGGLCENIPGYGVSCRYLETLIKVLKMLSNKKLNGDSVVVTIWGGKVTIDLRSTESALTVTVKSSDYSAVIRLFMWSCKIGLRLLSDIMTSDKATWILVRQKFVSIKGTSSNQRNYMRHLYILYRM